MPDYARVATESGYRTTMTTRSHRWHGDMNTDAGGTDTAPNPEELLLGALGSCIVMTLQLYAVRKGWPLERVEIDLELDKRRAEELPEYTGDQKEVSTITQKIVLHGALDAEQRARLMEIATKCPVSKVLRSDVFFSEEEVTALP
ncbi:MAG: OsmC family protein [Phototrophicaceae bacterium]